MKNKLKTKENLLRPKGEFETTPQYEARLNEYNSYKNAVKQECRAETLEKQKEEERLKQQALEQAKREDEKKRQEELKRQEEEERKKEEAIINSYKYVYLPIDHLSRYDADSRTYEITVQGDVYELKMEIEDAKSFKTAWRNVKVRAIFRHRFGDDEYLNYQLTHPVTKEVFLIGDQIDETEDKYLKEFYNRKGR